VKKQLVFTVLTACLLSACGPIRVRQTRPQAEGVTAALNFIAAYKAEENLKSKDLITTAVTWRVGGSSQKIGLTNPGLDSYEAFTETLVKEGFDPKTINADGKCRTEILQHMAKYQMTDLSAEEIDDLAQPCKPKPGRNLAPGEAEHYLVCEARDRIAELNQRMARQRKIEQASGVSDLRERRAIGSQLVEAREEEQEALQRYRETMGREYNGPCR
jgi:hypothetical protein